MREQSAFQSLLLRRLTELRFKNPSYSLRAFARKTGLPPSALSEILNGKRRVSKAMAKKVVQKLCLDPRQSEALLRLFPDDSRRSGGKAGRSIRFTSLDRDQYRLIADWYHFAILSLSETEGYRRDPAWISRRLGIRAAEASAALGRLDRLQLLSADAGAPVPSYHTSDEVADLSLRNAHFQNLELAKASLEEDTLEDRDFTAITMAIDPAKLPEAKKMIREFRDRLCAFMESGRKTEVHKMCVQLIPLTKKGRR